MTIRQKKLCVLLILAIRTDTVYKIFYSEGALKKEAIRLRYL